MRGLTISPASRALAIRQVARIAEHSADGRDPAGRVEEESALDRRFRSGTAGNVGMHFGERGHEELALAVDTNRSRRNLRLRRGRNRFDLAVAERAPPWSARTCVLVHRDHGDADKRGYYRLGIGRRRLPGPDNTGQHRGHEDSVGVHGRRSYFTTTELSATRPRSSRAVMRWTPGVSGHMSAASDDEESDDTAGDLPLDRAGRRRDDAQGQCLELPTKRGIDEVRRASRRVHDFERAAGRCRRGCSGRLPRHRHGRRSRVGQQAVLAGPLTKGRRPDD